MSGRLRSQNPWGHWTRRTGEGGLARRDCARLSHGFLCPTAGTGAGVRGAEAVTGNPETSLTGPRWLWRFWVSVGRGKDHRYPLHYLHVYVLLNPSSCFSLGGKKKKSPFPHPEHSTWDESRYLIPSWSPLLASSLLSQDGWVSFPEQLKPVVSRKSYKAHLGGHCTRLSLCEYICENSLICTLQMCVCTLSYICNNSGGAYSSQMHTQVY